MLSLVKMLSILIRINLWSKYRSKFTLDLKRNKDIGLENKMALLINNKNCLIAENEHVKRNTTMENVHNK